MVLISRGERLNFNSFYSKLNRIFCSSSLLHLPFSHLVQVGDAARSGLHTYDEGIHADGD